MKISTMFKAAIPSIALLASASIAGDAMAQDAKAAEKAAKMRQNYMQLVVFEAGPLFGMAKNPDTYDAAAAASAAADLKALASWDYPGAFLEGSSNADLPGKTRTLPAAWEDKAKLEQYFSDLRGAVDNLVAQAGEGPEALGGAVGAMGKVCGDCHKAFRAEKK